MWNDQGGGFFNSPNQFGAANTPGTKAKKTGKRNSRTAPIVIKQALSCSDDGVKLWGSDVQIVSIVARIRNIKVQSTKIVYTIQDMTGTMKAMLWVDQDAMNDSEDKSIPNVMVNTYVQIYGNVKTNQGKKTLVVFKMFNITNINAITFHYLQCINNKIKMETKSKGPGHKPETVEVIIDNYYCYCQNNLHIVKIHMLRSGADMVKTNDNSETSKTSMPANSMMGMDVGSAAAGLNPRQAMVFNLIRAAKLDKGTSKEDMQSSLQGQMSKMELEKILEWMCGEGHIYSTIDEDHFRATDAS